MSGHAAHGKVSKAHINRFRKSLLEWYDENRRELPWRALPGQRPDPYHVWLSEIMLQQTVVAAVIPYFLKFVKKWPTVRDLAAADINEVTDAWAGLGYYARARNLHKCAQMIAAKGGGKFPEDQINLKKLPGIGDYTSAAIAAIAFDQPASVVDGNVERVLARYFGVLEPLPDSKKMLRAYASILGDGRTDRPGDFAQAMMDLGATVCIPANPRCGSCPLQGRCAGFRHGNAANLPMRQPRKAKPQKFGYAYWVENDKGQVLFQRRPEKGILGGMIGLPASSWQEKQEALPSHPAWSGLKCHERGMDRVLHSFTHFDLELEGIYVDYEGTEHIPEGCFWLDYKEIKDVQLPSLFKKLVTLMLHHGNNR